MKRKRVKRPSSLAHARKRKKHNKEFSKRGLSAYYGEKYIHEINGERVTVCGAAIIGSDNEIYGSDNHIYGDDCLIFGNDNVITGDKNKVIGDLNHINGTNNKVKGKGNNIIGSSTSTSDDRFYSPEQVERVLIKRSVTINYGSVGNYIELNTLPFTTSDVDGNSSEDEEEDEEELSYILDRLYETDKRENGLEEIVLKIPKGIPKEYNPKNDDKSTLCKICLTNKKNTIIIDCGHHVMCSNCARIILKEKCKKCPVCRKEIKHGINEVFEV